ncbi:6-phosphogluconate dehydrogenase, NAD(+)-dependent, decarboxylating [bacterium HR36]|nr:6-phosphogluconate dehydrogenase, NAD(+)-dependent, decarboxylating [bacterium HR36]
MELGMVGLGRMGANMARRLMRRGHRLVVYDRDPETVNQLQSEGAIPSASLRQLVEQLTPPRIVWLMLPAGEVTEETILELRLLMRAGDLLVDGGNTYFEDDLRRWHELQRFGIDYVDVGVSGGVWGLERGYCLMVGGEKAVVARLEPILRDLAPGLEAAPRTAGRTGQPQPCELGYLHCGPVGAGHFVKMVHNGVEYALMQAYAEGVDLLRAAAQAEPQRDWRYEFDIPAILELWRRGSVVGSWLLDLAAVATARDPDLAAFTGQVPDSGEGRWTVETAVQLGVSLPAISDSLFARFRSRRGNSYGEKLLSALREQFGGHREH